MRELAADAIGHRWWWQHLLEGGERSARRVGVGRRAGFRWPCRACRLLRAGSRGHRRTADREQLGQYERGVLTTSPEPDQVHFLRGLELGRLPAQPALAFATRSFAGAGPGKVGLEPGDRHRVATMAFYSLLPNQQCRPGVIVVAAVVVVVAIL